jgi:hypothetical protein
VSRERREALFPHLDTCENRFLPHKGNFEQISKYRHSHHSVSIGSYASRAPFVTLKEQPSYTPCPVVGHVSLIKMDRMQGHDFDSMIRKPFQVPNSQNAASFQRAYQSSSHGNVSPVLFKMSAHTPRDNSMYPKLEDSP